MSIKLLVADDSITIQKVIGIIFGGEEYSLTVVDNGKSAIERAREICPDVLMIDALMPGMTGYEVAEAVRATPSLANKPVLILTGSFEPFDEDKARKCGADDFLAKPFESQQIVNKVKELAELGAAREKTAAPPAAPAEPLATVFEETATPAAAPQPQTSAQPFDPSDIWGAFTNETEQPKVAVAAAAAVTATEAVETFPAQPVEPFEFAAEPDVFAIVEEESGSQLLSPPAAAAAPQLNVASQWIPVEEQSFEFVEESVTEAPPAAIVQPPPASADFSFGEISFENDEPEPPAPAVVPATPPVAPPPPAEAELPAFGSVESLFPSFDVEPPVTPVTPIEPVADFVEPPEPVAAFQAQPALEPEPVEFLAQPAPEPEPVEFQTQPVLEPEPVAFQTPAADFFETPVALAAETETLASSTTPAPPAAELSEEQLKAAIAAVSKDVIERIVWEVVPDLAEALIKEAIRRIREEQ